MLYTKFIIDTSNFGQIDYLTIDTQSDYQIEPRNNRITFITEYNTDYILHCYRYTHTTNEYIPDIKIYMCGYIHKACIKLEKDCYRYTVCE